MNAYDLSGRNAVITGGGSGIGYATAERFLKSGAGVEIWGRDADKLKAAQASLKAFGPITCRSVDVSHWEQVEAGADAVSGQLGHIDILFNCAGLSLYVGPMLDVRVPSWRDTIAINLDSAFYCSKAFAPQMVERGYGRIINTSSMAPTVPSGATTPDHGTGRRLLQHANSTPPRQHSQHKHSLRG